MLIEIPDPEVILEIVVAFFVGLFGLYFYFKLKPYIKLKPGFDPSQVERLEYYERQLIDMKIKLDALDMEEQSTKLFDSEINQIEKLAKKDIKKNNHESLEKTNQQIHRAPNMGYQNATDYVLRLITDKSMTSRDIQITLGRSREHTSRLMKKLFDDGYVKRSSDSKPYSYLITEKGKEKLKLLSVPTTI